jgi:hypothetical protein
MHLSSVVLWLDEYITALLFDGRHVRVGERLAFTCGIAIRCRDDESKFYLSLLSILYD